MLFLNFLSARRCAAHKSYTFPIKIGKQRCLWVNEGQIFIAEFHASRGINRRALTHKSCADFLGNIALCKQPIYLGKHTEPCRRIHNHLTGGKERNGIYIFEGTLADCIKGGKAVNLVAEEFATDGKLHIRTVEVNDTATAGKLSTPLNRINGVKAEGDKPLRKLLRRDFITDLQGKRKRGKHITGHGERQCRRGCGDNRVNIARNYAGQDG